MRCCCGGDVVGVMASKVAGEGMGTVSSVRRDVRMARQKVSGVKSGCLVGAVSMSVQIGLRAWCKICATVYRVSVRWLLVHSMWRCGVLPFFRDRRRLQNGQWASSSGVGGGVLGRVMRHVWFLAYVVLLRRARVCEGAV